MSKYTVNFYETHPDEENDDCNTGEDYDDKEDALLYFHSTDFCYLSGRSKGRLMGNYVCIDGPDLNEVRMRDGFDREAHDRRRAREDDAFDREWRSEMAHQAGMGYGVEAYNEVMGYD